MSETLAIDGDWSRSCGHVPTIVDTIGFGLYRGLYRWANFQFYGATLITGHSLLACLLATRPVRTQVFLALKKRGAGSVVGTDNFNSYYEISLKTSAGQEPLAKQHIFCVPFSELHQTDQPASLYAATEKAGEDIAHEYI
ncbi:unnamed protein product [Sphagnum jensenii]